jgi:hypothetical protein
MTRLNDVREYLADRMDEEDIEDRYNEARSQLYGTTRDGYWDKTSRLCDAVGAGSVALGSVGGGYKLAELAVEGANFNQKAAAGLMAGAVAATPLGALAGRAISELTASGLEKAGEAVLEKRYGAEMQVAEWLDGKDHDLEKSYDFL